MTEQRRKDFETACRTATDEQLRNALFSCEDLSNRLDTEANAAEKATIIRAEMEKRKHTNGGNPCST
jgi:hypothetical protein